MAAQEIGSLYIGLGFDTAVFDRQIVQIPQKIKPASDAIEKGFRGASKELDNFNNKMSGATKAGLQNLSFQLNDIGTSLASGSSPFRVLAQQGGQIVQVFQQVGFKNIATAVVGMITPFRLVAAGAIAAGAAFGGLLLRAQSNAEQLRSFNVLLERTGRLAQNIDIGGQNSRLRELGISRDTATAQRLAIARNPRLNIGTSEAFSTLGANIGARTGLGPEAGFQQLMTAVEAGPEATIRLALAMGALSEKQAAALISSSSLTGGLKEQNQALAALHTTMAGFVKDTVDPMTSATNKLAAAWENFTNKLTQHSFVQNNLKFFTQQLNELADLMTAKEPGPVVDWRAERNRIIRGGTPPGGGSYPSLGLQPGGALTRAATPSADIGRLQNFFSDRLDAWLAALDDSERTAIRITSGFSLTHAAGGAHSFGLGVDSRGVSMAAAASLARFGLHMPVPGDWGHIEPIESPSAATNTRGARTAAFAAMAAGGPGAPPQVDARDPQRAQDIAKAAEEQRRQNAADIPIQRLWNVEQVAAAAAEEARRRVRAMPESTPAEAEAAATAAATAARAKYNIELGKENTLTGMRIEAERKVALAMLESEGAAVRVNAAEQAAIETRQRGGSVATRAQQALAARGAAAETSLAQGVVGGKRDIEEAQLRVSLLGESTEHIERQIALLRVRQQVEAAGVPVAQSIVDARIAGVNKLQDELDLLARQRRVMDSIKEVAGVFESAFGRAFDSISDGTFRLRKFLGDLLKDLAKTLASQSFKRLLGGDSGEGGLLGSIAGKLFPSLLGKAGSGIDVSSIGGPAGDFANFATGGSFAVGGSGSIDSQLVAFRATPGEMVQISPANSNYSSGRGEVIHINLNPSEGWVAGVADQRIVTRSGQIIDVAVKQSQRTVQRNFAGMSAEAQARTA